MKSIGAMAAILQQAIGDDDQKQPGCCLARRLSEMMHRNGRAGVWATLICTLKESPFGLRLKCVHHETKRAISQWLRMNDDHCWCSVIVQAFVGCPRPPMHR